MLSKTLLSSTATNTQYHQTLTALPLKCLTLFALLLAHYKELPLLIESNLKWCNGKGNEQIRGVWEIYCVFTWFGFLQRVILWLCCLLSTNGCFPDRPQLCWQVGMLDNAFVCKYVCVGEGICVQNGPESFCVVEDKRTNGQVEKVKCSKRKLQWIWFVLILVDTSLTSYPACT